MIADALNLQEKKTDAKLCGQEGLYVEGTLEGTPVHMTIDAGSSRSILRHQMLQHIGLDPSSIHPTPNCLRSVTGERKPMSGRITLKIGVAGYELLHNFWVADINEDCILGLDFLIHHGCHLDIKDKLITVEDVTIPLPHMPGDGSDFGCYRVVAIENTYIKPYTEAVVPARVLGYSGQSNWGIIEPTVNQSISGLVVGKVLTTLSNRVPIVPVRMANVSDEQQDILAGADLARCELVGCVAEPKEITIPKATISAETRMKLPEHLTALYGNSTKDLTIPTSRGRKFITCCVTMLTYYSPKDQETLEGLT